MTAAEAKTAFLRYYDRVTSFSAPGYRDNEIYQFLTDAQLQFVKERTFGLGNLPPRFDDNEKRVADLFPLIETSKTISMVADTDYGNTWKYSKSGSDLTRPLFTFRIEAECKRSGHPTMSTAKFIECDRIKNENAGKFRSNTFNKPHFVNPKWFETNNFYYVIADAYTTDVSGIIFTYIQEPYPIVSGMVEYDGTFDASHMSLQTATHQEIVDIAVKNALQVIGDPRWNTKMQQEQIEQDK